MVKADKRARAKITPERQGELLVNRKQAETESHRYRGTVYQVYNMYLRAGRVRETYRGGFSAVLTNFPKLGGNTEYIRPKS